MMKGQPIHPAIARVQIKKIFLVKDWRALFLDKVGCNECPTMIIGWPVGEKKAKGTDAKVSQMFRLQKSWLLWLPILKGNTNDYFSHYFPSW